MKQPCISCLVGTSSWVLPHRLLLVSAEGESWVPTVTAHSYQRADACPALADAAQVISDAALLQTGALLGESPSQEVLMRRGLPPPVGYAHSLYGVPDSPVGRWDVFLKQEDNATGARLSMWRLPLRSKWFIYKTTTGKALAFAASISHCGVLSVVMPDALARLFRFVAINF